MIPFMRLKETLQKASRATQLFHRQTNRRLGLWHMHKQIDISYEDYNRIEEILDKELKVKKTQKD